MTDHALSFLDEDTGVSYLRDALKLALEHTVQESTANQRYKVRSDIAIFLISPIMMSVLYHAGLYERQLQNRKARSTYIRCLALSNELFCDDLWPPQVMESQ